MTTVNDDLASKRKCNHPYSISHFLSKISNRSKVIHLMWMVHFLIKILCFSLIMVLTKHSVYLCTLRKDGAVEKYLIKPKKYKIKKWYNEYLKIIFVSLQFNIFFLL